MLELMLFKPDISMRYLHRRNRSLEKQMLENFDERRYRMLKRGGKYIMEFVDVEALMASLLMTDSYRVETDPIRDKLNGD
jgi:hypothetical protein